MAFNFIEGAPTISTDEYSLVNNSTTIAELDTPCQAQLFLDLNNLTMGDTLVITLREKTRAADTQRIIEQWVITNNVGSSIWVSPSLLLARGWDFTLQRTTGSNIVIPYSIRYVT
jgi:hypothetical protein